MNIVILGKPGSGKGTHAELLAKHFGLYHISTGELFRKHVNEGTEVGEKIKRVMHSPNFVSDGMINEIIKKELDEKDHDNIIFDGYPRTLVQADFLDKVLKNQIDHFLVLDISDKTAIERMVNRHNEKPRPETKNIDMIKDRIQVHDKLVAPMIDKYKREGKLKFVNGERSIEEVHEDVKRKCQQ